MGESGFGPQSDHALARNYQVMMEFLLFATTSSDKSQTPMQPWLSPKHQPHRQYTEISARKPLTAWMKMHDANFHVVHEEYYFELIKELVWLPPTPQLHRQTYKSLA